ncbi:MAG: hypothetical protein LBE33_06105 [Zoogloeaceae bacterium]|jgi:hypothetical protein|nr:hypothetical protein [Zoogloeaceae bacterium]
MAKATVIVDVSDLSEVAAIELWFSRWKDKLDSVSENDGCGCCVDIWKVEGPQAAFEELPPQCYGRDE